MQRRLALEDRETEPPEDSLRSPLDDIYVDFLMSKKRESPELDLKLILDISRERFAEIAKDIFAMSNYGGGYVLVGWKQKEKGGFEPVGLPEDLHLEQAHLQEKFNAYSSERVALGYREFGRFIEGQNRRFALLYVPASISPLYPRGDGFARISETKERKVFQRGEILFRRGTQSVPASAEEREHIKQRAGQTDYQISLISGVPDKVREALYSNLFAVRHLPEKVYEARLSSEQVLFPIRREMPFVVQSPFAYSFDNPAKGPLKPFIQQGTITANDPRKWLEDKDRRNIVLWLLDSSLIYEAGQRGMWEWKKKVFFPLREGETSRFESWPGLSRASSRQVATTMFAQQLGESVGVHPAVDVHFTWVGEKLYLRLWPTFVLTKDGRHVRSGEREGTVITRLTHAEYNKAYLRNVFFWASKLGAEEGRWRLLSGEIEIDSQPMKAQVSLGIRSDRPTLEALKLEPEQGEE